VPHGTPVKFGIATSKAILHFSTLNAVRQSAGVKDARARLWELYRAKELSAIPQAGLIMAAPHLDDITLSKKQREAARRNLAEIESEADSYQMRFFPVHTVPQAGEALIQIAG
jgi:hypothetical protein